MANSGEHPVHRLRLVFDPVRYPNLYASMQGVGRRSIGSEVLRLAEAGAGVGDAIRDLHAFVLAAREGESGVSIAPPARDSKPPRHVNATPEPVLKSQAATSESRESIEVGRIRGMFAPTDLEEFIGIGDGQP